MKLILAIISTDDTKANLDVLEKYIDSPNDSTILIFTCVLVG